MLLPTRWRTLKKIKLYDRLDPTTQAGKEARENLLDGDMMEGFFNALPFLNYPKMIANLQNMLAKPDSSRLRLNGSG